MHSEHPDSRGGGVRVPPPQQQPLLRLLARAGTALARDGMDMGICGSVGGVAYRVRHFGTIKD